MRTLEGKGPDAEDGSGKGGGSMWGAPYKPGLAWRKAPGGWYWVDQGHKPQNLARLECHPRLTRWQAVKGAGTEHWWRVPVMIAPVPGQADVFVSAVDRILGPSGFAVGEDLEPIQRKCLAIAMGLPLAETAEERDAECAKLAIELLAFGQWVCEGWLHATGWLTESVMVNVLKASIGEVLDDVRD